MSVYIYLRNRVDRLSKLMLGLYVILMFKHTIMGTYFDWRPVYNCFVFNYFIQFYSE